MDKNAGYAIKSAILFDNGRGFALGENPKAPAPFVTWQFTEENGKRDYYWGHYHGTEATAKKDFDSRGADYLRRYAVKVTQIEAPGLYKYYSTQRPVDIGTFPKPPDNAPDEITNYDRRIPVEGGAFLAWGELTYTKPLTEKQASDYELRPAPNISALWREDSGRPRPIAQQMKEAAMLAEAGRDGHTPKMDAPDRGDR